MSQRVQTGTISSSPSLKRSLLFGACFVALIGGQASASVIGSTTAVSFAGGSVSFGEGTTDFTFSDLGGGIFNFSPVAVSTSGGGAVTSFFGAPTTYFDPVRGSGVLLFDSSYTFSSFTAPVAIDDSAFPFIIGLVDVTSDGPHYGYAEFDGSTLVSYAFESEHGVGIFTPVPLPASAPMFAAACVAIGVVGYGMKRIAPFTA